MSRFVVTMRMMTTKMRMIMMIMMIRMIGMMIIMITRDFQHCISGDDDD